MKRADLPPASCSFGTLRSACRFSNEKPLPGISRAGRWLHSQSKRANIAGKRPRTQRSRDGDQERRTAGNRVRGFRRSFYCLRDCAARLPHHRKYADAAAKRGGARHSGPRHGDRRDRPRHRHFADRGFGGSTGACAPNGTGRPHASDFPRRSVCADDGIRPREWMADRLRRGAVAVHDAGLRSVPRRPRSSRALQARRRPMEPRNSTASNAWDKAMCWASRCRS